MQNQSWNNLEGKIKPKLLCTRVCWTPLTIRQSALRHFDTRSYGNPHRFQIDRPYIRQNTGLNIYKKVLFSIKVKVVNETNMALLIYELNSRVFLGKMNLNWFLHLSTWLIVSLYQLCYILKIIKASITICLSVRLR